MADRGRLVGSDVAGDRLRQTTLREFSSPDEHRSDRQWHRRTVSRSEIPLTHLGRYALELIGLPSHGPAEKVAWWVDFSYQGRQARLTLQKFGLRLFVEILDGDVDAAELLANGIVKKLSSSMRTIETLVLTPAAKELFKSGRATVVNQHLRLKQAYDYFRDKAANPIEILDETVRHENGGLSFTSGSTRMRLNSFYDLVAATNAYLSLFEHDMVLSLPFVGYDPSEISLQEFIGLRWGDKFARVFDISRPEDKRYRDRLIEVVERWRNTYSHGGFEKGHGSTVYLHYQGLGAIPVGLSSSTGGSSLWFVPATEDDVGSVFALFDEIDAWLAERRIPQAMEWIEAGLDVRFDAEFRQDAAEAMADPNLFTSFVDLHGYLWDRTANMDY